MTQIHIQTAIIGAGPAGLAVAGRLRKLNLPFEIFEKENSVGNSWRNHYDRLHLHTVKKLSGLPHLPLPENYPQYASRQQVVDYLEQYADHFNIQPHFKKGVQHLQKNGDHWEIQFENGSTVKTNHVVIATGVNRIPNVPVWPGQQGYTGKILHSRDYRNPGDIEGERVLVIGMGNTGAEIALDLAEHNKKTFLSVRSPVSIVPRDINGHPTQLTAKALEKIPFGIGESIGNLIRKIVVGDLKKYGIEEPKLPPAKQLKETGKTPVLDIGTLKYIKSGKIKVVKDIDHFYTKGVVTKDEHKVPVQSVVLATGYRAGIEDMLGNTDRLLDPYGVPKSPIGSGIFNGLYFVGFDNYKLGGILGTIWIDSKLVVEQIEKE